MAEVGEEFVQPNGYTRVKTENGWVGKQRLVAEEKLGRSLKSNERVYFGDGDITNFDPNNIIVKQKAPASTKKIDSIKYLLKRLDKVEEEAAVIRQSLEELLERDIVNLPSLSESTEV